jgi:hypothetical protein
VGLGATLDADNGYDARAASAKGYAASQAVRKRIEQGWDCGKTVADLRQLPRMGMATVRGWVTYLFAGRTIRSA